MAVLFLILNVVGEVLTVKGKVVPEIMNIRKYFARKKKERETLAEMMATLPEVKKSLNELNAHYSADNIKMRDGWMDSVNTALKDINSWRADFDKKLDENSENTLDILIENKRSAIINFASFVIEESNPVTREQFNRIFRLHKGYEKIISSKGLTNGEVDIAIRIIRESYEQHMRNHTFVEDVRGYEPTHKENP